MRTKRVSLINRAQVKKYFLDRAEMRAHKFTRVGADVLDEAENHLKVWIDRFVQSHPSVGKTISTGKKNE